MLLWMWICCIATLANSSEFTLPNALAEALGNNFSVRIERLNEAVAADQLSLHKATFTPFAFSQFQRAASESFQNSIDFTSRNGIRRWDESSWRLRSGIGGTIATGTQYEIFVSVYSVENALNRVAPSPNALFSPEVETFAGIKLTQPLLQNAGWVTHRTEAQILHIGRDIASLETRIHIDNLAIDVVDAYYNTVFAAFDRQVKQDAVATAEHFMAMTREWLSVGRASEMDLAQAEMNLAETIERRVMADHNFANSLLRLHQLIGRNAPDGSLPAVRFPELQPIPTVDYDSQKWIQMALRERLDLQLAMQRRSEANLRERYARHQRLPELNVELSYGYSGFGGTVSDSFDLLRDRDEPAWAIGVTVRIPLWNSRDDAMARIAERRRQQSTLTVSLRENDIAYEVRRALARLEVFEQRRHTAQQSIRVAENLVRTEQERHANGRTTTYAVLEAQQRLDEARTRALAAHVDSLKAVQELWAVSGQLLSRNGFQLPQ